MSAIFSLATPGAVYMITDRAGYDTDGVVQYLGGKVSASIKPLAIVTRGDVRIGEHWRRHLLALVHDKGIHGALAMLPGILERMSADPALRAAQSGEHYVEVTITGWSPACGGFHLRFDTADWRVKELDAAAYAGPMDADPREYFVYPNDGETPEAWMRRGGVAMMEAFRSQRGRDKEGHSAECFWIGGGLDFTIIDRDGVRTETILEWPDVVGEKIDPQRAA